MTATAAGRLTLPQVTLVCVDTQQPALALAAMQRCRAQADFGDAVLFTDAAAAMALPDGIRREAVQIGSVAAYSQFMLRGLLPHIHTSHLLVVQWDGWLTDARAWTDEFLATDYIGPPWVDQPPGREVGNGGFSLRSRRLLQALTDPVVQPAHPEDACICRTHRSHLEQAHGIRFAPLALAQRFGHEHAAPGAGPRLGFHGLFNLPHVLDDDALQAVLDALPPRDCFGLGGRMLWRTLLQQRRLALAGRWLDKAASTLSAWKRARYRARFWLARLA